MRSRCLRGVLALTFLQLGTALASAQTVNWTVTCTPDAVVGPVTVLATQSTPYSGTVTLTPGTPSTVALLPTNNVTRQDDSAAAAGTYTGVLACTLTLGGVTVPFTRSLSLDVPPAGPSGTGTMTTGATSFTVDLGAPGLVNVSVPAGSTLGFNRALVNGGVIIVPLVIDTTLLLAAPVPLPLWSLVLSFAAMILVGSLIARRRWRTV